MFDVCPSRCRCADGELFVSADDAVYPVFVEGTRIVGVSIEVLKKIVTKYKNNDCAEKTEHEVKKDVRLAVRDEYRFETEAVGDRMDGVLH